MKNNEKDDFRFRHILESIDKILFLVTDKDFTAFEADWIIQDAVMRNFEIIGEAAKNVKTEIKDKYPDLDWKPAYGLRNFIIHEYFYVDLEAIWESATSDLPNFKIGLEEILKNLEN